MSPKSFRAELRELSLESHWRQWCALGVAGQVRPERHWVIDLEALVVSTSRVAPTDARLLRRTREWLALNHDRVSTSLLRCIGQVFVGNTTLEMVIQ
jgi:hypothetical protein